MSDRSAIIIAARRTAIGKLGGLHTRRPIEDLAAPVIKALLHDGAIDPADVDEVIFGNAVGGGGNPARLAALAAGLPDTIPALTIDRQCASGLDAIIQGARMIQSGTVNAVIAGGVESASTAPWRVSKPANLFTDLPQFYSQASFVPAEHGDPGMIEAAENVAKEYGVSRDRQDRFALESHRRATGAQAREINAAEIVRLQPHEAEQVDEGPRAALSLKLLARMPPLMTADGTVTAGNSCQINDGAAVVLIVSRDLHQRLGSPPGLAFAAAASAGIAPRILGLAAVPAFKKLQELACFDLGEVATIELNEAFAAQVLATVDQLNLPMEKFNPYGGALAYGHPYGASGAILVVRLFSALVRETPNQPGTTGLAMIAAAGGVGVAALFHTI